VRSAGFCGTRLRIFGKGTLDLTERFIDGAVLWLALAASRRARAAAPELDRAGAGEPRPKTLARCSLAPGGGERRRDFTPRLRAQQNSTASLQICVEWARLRSQLRAPSEPRSVHEDTLQHSSSRIACSRRLGRLTLSRARRASIESEARIQLSIPFCTNSVHFTAMPGDSFDRTAM
jgi:hypothetical protein